MSTPESGYVIALGHPVYLYCQIGEPYGACQNLYTDSKLMSFADLISLN